MPMNWNGAAEMKTIDSLFAEVISADEREFLLSEGNKNSRNFPLGTVESLSSSKTAKLVSMKLKQKA